MKNLFNHWNGIEIMSFLAIGFGIVGMFLMHMVPMVFAGFVVFLFIKTFYGLLKSKTRFAKWLAMTGVVSGTLFVLIFVGFVIYWSVKSGSNHISQEGIDGLLLKLTDIIQKLKTYLPLWLANFIPSSSVGIKAKAVELIQGKGQNLLQITDGSLRFLAKFIIGLFLGLIVGHSSISQHYSETVVKPFSKALLERITSFYTVFCQVVTAQVKISLLNTMFTGIFLLIVFPLFGVHLPYAKTIVVFTFVAGLLPVIGNLITNSIIVLMGLTVSFPVAMAALGFLIGVHKLEYFLNAKIVGHEIKTSIWEILIAMVIMEHIFGLAGVITAPILYGYIKKELVAKGLV